MHSLAPAFCLLSGMTSLRMPDTWCGLGTGAAIGMTCARTDVLCQVLPHMPGLVLLDLACTGLGHGRLRALAPVLKQLTALTVLVLPQNQLRDAAAPLLVQTLCAMPALRKCDLRQNGFSEKVKRLLGQRLEGAVLLLDAADNTDKDA
jgi:Ran GTPase-activating protein (RanGAP) involved in mRNA processing and transport